MDTCISKCSSPIRVLWSHITQRGDIEKKMYFFQPFACSQKKVATFLILTATIYVRHDITRLRAVASSRLASVFFCHHENPKYLRREFNHTRCLCYNFFFLATYTVRRLSLTPTFYLSYSLKHIKLHHSTILYLHISRASITL